MSSTRKAKDDSEFHQARYASSPAFERGLLANLVAKRAALLDDPADRDLIWFIHHLSHQEYSLGAVIKDLVARYPDRIQTEEMARIGMKPGTICNGSQVKMICEGFGDEANLPFLLDGGYGKLGELLHEDAQSAQKTRSYPCCYPAQDFVDECRRVAEENLEKRLNEICLDPKSSLKYGTWYFPNLIATLREYRADFIKQNGAGVVITALGQKVCDALDYAAYSRGLTLIQGESRRGKSFAAQKWCIQRPGLAPFVEVPPSNDDVGFFRALARGIGLGNFLNYKAAQIRERVESVLLAGDHLLVLDEAQRLWPQSNYRQAFPRRIVWVMAMANAGVPIAMIATPQFIETQKAVEQTGWNSAQLTGRISHYECLPEDLSREDLMAVAKCGLPEVEESVLRSLAIYARSSSRYLAAIDSISKRARYLAMRSGRSAATTADVRQAMKESVIPADTKLQRALASGKKPKDLPAAQQVSVPTPALGQAAQQDSLPAAGRPSAGSSPVPVPEMWPPRARGDIEAVLTGS